MASAGRRHAKSAGLQTLWQYRAELTREKNRFTISHSDDGRSYAKREDTIAPAQQSSAQLPEITPK